MRVQQRVRSLAMLIRSQLLTIVWRETHFRSLVDVSSKSSQLPVAVKSFFGHRFHFLVLVRITKGVVSVQVSLLSGLINVAVDLLLYVVVIVCQA